MKREQLHLVVSGASVVALFLPYDKFFGAPLLLATLWLPWCTLPFWFGLLLFVLDLRRLWGRSASSSESLTYLLLAILSLLWTLFLAVEVRLGFGLTTAMSKATIEWELQSPAPPLAGVVAISSYCIGAIVVLLRQRLPCSDEARVSLILAYIPFAILQCWWWGNFENMNLGAKVTLVIAVGFVLEILCLALASIKPTRRQLRRQR